MTSSFISLQSMVEKMVPKMWPALRSFLTYSSPNCLFQKVHYLKKPLPFTPHMASTHFLVFCLTGPTAKSLTKALQAQLVSQEMS